MGKEGSARETLRAELERFALQLHEGKVKKGDPLSPDLKRVLRDMKDAGVPFFEWHLLRPLIRHALITSLDEFREKYPNTDTLPSSSSTIGSGAEGSGAAAGNSSKQLFEQHKQRLIAAINHLQGAPFTLQRLCELVAAPEESYNCVSKLLFGLEKLLSVSSVVNVARPEEKMPSEIVRPDDETTQEDDREDALASSSEDPPTAPMGLEVKNDSKAHCELDKDALQDTQEI